jgi:septal ring factor EnvC (AmiA/AmiB activator)
MQEKRDVFERFELWTNKMRSALIAATMLALVVVSAWSLVKGVVHFAPEPAITSQNTFDKEIQELQHSVSVLKERQQTLDKTLAGLKSNTSQYANLSPLDRQALTQLAADKNAIDLRLRALEDALRLDASKALTVPILRKDMEALQEKSKSDLTLVQNELGRLFSLAQWFMGAIVTIALAVASLVFSGRKKTA